MEVFLHKILGCNSLELFFFRLSAASNISCLDFSKTEIVRSRFCFRKFWDNIQKEATIYILWMSNIFDKIYTNIFWTVYGCRSFGIFIQTDYRKFFQKQKLSIYTILRICTLNNNKKTMDTSKILFYAVKSVFYAF